MTTDTLTRPSALAAIGETAPEEGGRWEVHLAYRLETSNTVVDLRAIIDFVRIGQFFSGQTVVAFQAGDDVRYRVDADVEGELTKSLVMLDLHMQEGVLSVSPFFCTGEAKTEGKRYEGHWHMPCLKPQTCGCDGDDGAFSLTRIG
ncbi:hypothetical protein [Henriciella aquimarina]|uniref:hypothetical protein n=1 Tax=Henriciella aquimarina TaxID=545261 RepID=UPI000A06444F|nr:hypothetical protein [Henriciella aquimarina]